MHLLRYKGLDLDPRKINESTTVKPNVLPESKVALQEADSSSGKPKVLLPKIEAIHAGSTRNSTRYPADKLKGDASLKSGVYSWTNPYPKPVIYNHDTNTDATGRIHNAYFSSTTQAGKEGIIVIPRITDPTAVDAVLEGRLLTVSIGAHTDSAICSICGTDVINEGFCGHMKGDVYDGQKCEWIIGNVWFDELSWVNVPSDQFAMVTSLDGQPALAEAFAESGRGFVNLGKKTHQWVLSTAVATTEGLITSMSEKGDTPMILEELQAKNAELEENLTKANELNESLENEKNSLVAEKEALTQENEQLKTQVEEVNASVEVKTAEVAEANSKLEEAESQVSTLKTTLEATEAEKASLLEKNAELATEAHQSLVERVVDMKVVLGKESAREEAITRHLERSTESLHDTLADLMTEQASVKPGAGRARQQLNNPGQNNLDDEGGLSEAERQQKIEETLRSLFRGPANQQNRK